MDEESNDDTEKSILLLANSWLTRNSKWLTLKSIEMTLIGSWAQWTPHAPDRNVLNMCYFVTGTYHQIGMDYLYDAIFKIAASEVKLRFRLLTEHLG